MDGTIPETRLMLLGIGAVAVYLLAVTIGRVLKRRWGVRLGWIYRLFCVVLALYVVVVAFAPAFSGRKELASAAIILGAFVVVSLLQRFLWERYFQEICQTPIPNLVRDVAALIIVVATVVVVLSVNYGVRIPGLLAGSGIAALVIGLAMQDLLSNIIAGVALHIAKPFTVGDWLLVGDRHVQVMEIHWRATRARTNDEIYLDIPNRDLASQTIVNLYYPTHRHAQRLTVGIEYGAAPNRVKEVLRHATQQVSQVLAEPAPRVFLKSFDDSAITYEVRFWLDDHSHYNEVFDAVRTNIWYELRRAGITIPFPIRTVHLERTSVQRQQDEARAIARSKLLQQPLLQGLGQEQLDTLTAGARIYRFGRGERLITQGAEGESLFVLLQGEAEVLVAKDGQPVPVGKLRLGDGFGEMSLLTGETRSATVVAQSDCEVAEIDRPLFALVLQQQPEFVRQLSELMAQRRLQNEGILAAAIPTETLQAKQREYADSFLKKLAALFNL